MVGCLSLALELEAGAGPAGDAAELEAFVDERLRFLLTARPTAVNLGREAERLRAFARRRAQSPGVTAQGLQERYRGDGTQGPGEGGAWREVGEMLGSPGGDLGCGIIVESGI